VVVIRRRVEVGSKFKKWVVVDAAPLKCGFKFAWRQGDTADKSLANQRLRMSQAYWLRTWPITCSCWSVIQFTSEVAGDNQVSIHWKSSRPSRLPREGMSRELPPIRSWKSWNLWRCGQGRCRCGLPPEYKAIVSHMFLWLTASRSTIGGALSFGFALTFNSGYEIDEVQSTAKAKC